MSTAQEKTLEFERLRKLVKEGDAYTALKDLQKLAKLNRLTEVASRLLKIKENLQYLDNHLKANSIDPMFANAKRNGLMFEIIELLDELEERKDLKVSFAQQKEVNLILNAPLGLNDTKRKALMRTMEKILGVSSENIAIEVLSR